ncbi:MAG: protein-glutamine glutaminase family protein [Bacteriovoracaceae bacterium]
MKILFILILNLIFQSVHAESFITKIHSIEYSTTPGIPHLVKFVNGRVGFLEQENSLRDKSLLTSKKQLEIFLDEKNTLISIKKSLDHHNQFTSYINNEDSMPFDPSEISEDEASAIFNRMRIDFQYHSECYNRAHVWSYEEFQRSGLKSMKLFMFFTSKYIYRYRYQWWFHVTPMAYLKNSNKQMITLDRRFTKKPLLVKDWSDNFIYSKRECPLVKKYSDYSDHQTEEDCFLLPVSMYFWQPRDIEYFEQTGIEKKEFITSELNWAYNEAF